MFEAPREDWAGTSVLRGTPVEVGSIEKVAPSKKVVKRQAQESFQPQKDKKKHACVFTEGAILTYGGTARPVGLCHIQHKLGGLWSLPGARLH